MVNDESHFGQIKSRAKDLGLVPPREVVPLVSNLETCDGRGNTVSGAKSS